MSAVKSASYSFTSSITAIDDSFSNCSSLLFIWGIVGGSSVYTSASTRFITSYYSETTKGRGCSMFSLSNLLTDSKEGYYYWWVCKKLFIFTEVDTFLPPAAPIISALLHLVIDLRFALLELRFNEWLPFYLSLWSLLHVEFIALESNDLAESLFWSLAF